MKHGGAASDPTHAACRRLGLMRMPLACVILRIVVHSFQQTQLYAGLWEVVEVQQALVLKPHVPTFIPDSSAAAAAAALDLVAAAADADTAVRRLLEKNGSIGTVSVGSIGTVSVAVAHNQIVELSEVHEEATSVEPTGEAEAQAFLAGKVNVSVDDSINANSSGVNCCYYYDHNSINSSNRNRSTCSGSSDDDSYVGTNSNDLDEPILAGIIHDASLDADNRTRANASANVHSPTASKVLSVPHCQHLLAVVLLW
jgi:hypothetical protein